MFKEVVGRACKRAVSELMLEFDTGGNVRFEEGRPGDVWFSSCADLVKSRMVRGRQQGSETMRRHSCRPQTRLLSTFRALCGRLFSMSNDGRRASGLRLPPTECVPGLLGCTSPDSSIKISVCPSTLPRSHLWFQVSTETTNPHSLLAHPHPCAHRSRRRERDRPRA